MKNIPIRTEFITLGQLLKLADLIDTGGQAKQFLREHAIFVNGQPENRRGRKLRPGDVVQVEGSEPFQVIGREADCS